MKCPHVFCTDMFEVLVLPVVNAVHFLVLGEMLFILARAPFLMAFLVFVVYLIVQFIRFYFFTAVPDALSFALNSSFSCISAHCNSTQDVCVFGRVYSDVQLLWCIVNSLLFVAKCSKRN